MYSYLVLLLALCSTFKQTEQNIILSFCKGTPEGEWRDKVRDIFGITKVGIAELFCTGLSRTDIAVGTLVGEDYEQIIKPPNQHLNVFLANLLRRMSSSVITTVTTSDELRNALKNDQNKSVIVSFIETEDSIEHQVFQQVALSIYQPDEISIIVSHDRELLNNFEILVNDTESKLQTWFVKNDKWLLLEVPEIGGEVTTEEAHLKLSSYLKNLNYPLIYSYNDDDFLNDVYEGANLDFALIFHTTEQKKEIIETVVEPLSKEFQLYFAFITIDCDKFPEMLTIHKIDTDIVTLPLLMSLKNKQKRGVKIESEKVSYTDLDALVKVLNLIRNDKPEVIPVDEDYKEENATTSEETQKHDHSEL